MKLHEYQSKRIFAKYDVPIPEGDVATTLAEARQIAQRLGGPVVVKAQVLVGGRGKAGGIKVARDADEAEALADQILGMTIKGLTVEKVLIDQAADIREEIYLGITIDRTQRKPVMMASSEGGIEIEEVARVTPEKIFKLAIDPAMDLMDFQARNLGFDLGMRRTFIRQFTTIAKGLYRAFVESDASLAEINPLVVTGDEKLLAVDGKIVLDDNALFRHRDLTELRDVQEEAEAERQARQAGLSYVKLDGEIGCMVNGAGLAMATMDLIKLYGGNPANFLDVGGGATKERVTEAFKIILSDQNVKGILVNIFGGIVRCDLIAEGIIGAVEEVDVHVPVVVRLEGNKADLGAQKLEDSGLNIIAANGFSEAAKKIVQVVKQQGVVA